MLVNLYKKVGFKKRKKMKRYVILWVFLISVLGLNAQHFEQFFVDKTLRINYLHIGKNDSEKIVIDSYYAGEGWTGTRAHLVEEQRYGDMLFEVFDATSKKLIFSKDYNCLFTEYRSTERAETEVGKFEECMLLPYPKAKITYRISSYTRSHKKTILYEGEFDPQKETVKPFTKEYKVLDLHKGGKPEECLDILFLPDGYSQNEKKLLKADMKKFADYIINCAPYSEYKKNVNIRAIEGYSEESGITDPNANIYKKTLLNSSYNVIDVDRYLMCLNVWKMHDIAEDAPYDLIVIVANSPKYGGGGIYNFYATVNSIGQYSDYVIVHELGHLFGGLADEYYNSEVSVRDFYPETIEPAEPNLTTMIDFSSKWKEMLPEGTPVPTPDTKEYDGKLGVFEGGGYVAEGVFRPWRDCTMKDIKYDNFCPVCHKVLTEKIKKFSK